MARRASEKPIILSVAQAVLGVCQAGLAYLRFAVDDLADPGEEPWVEHGHTVNFIV